VIIERKVSVGQVVQPADQLFSVANLSSVWVVGGVPEQDARAVRKGQQVEIQVPALGDVLQSGRIVFVADTVNPATRTVMVRSEVANASQQLKPAMLATMRIAGAVQPRLVVPAAAVVREANRDHVFVAQGDYRYVLTPVELGAAVGELRPVLKGLSAAQLVVVDGSFHLNNERKRAELE
jgi:Membrane-fusion protein